MFRCSFQSKSMKYRLVITTNPGKSLLLLAVFLVIATTINGCKQNTGKSSSSRPEAPTLIAESPSVQLAVPTDDTEVSNPPIETNELPLIVSQPELDEMIQLAAGPMADSVNSSLARLNTNLGRKEHTLVLMAMKSETRRWYFLTHMVSIIDKQQIQQATTLIDSYGDTWQDLLDRRARILESERDGKRVQAIAGLQQGRRNKTDHAGKTTDSS